MFIDAEDDPNAPGPSCGRAEDDTNAPGPSSRRPVPKTSRTSGRRSALQEEGIVFPPNQFIDIANILQFKAFWYKYIKLPDKY